MLISPRIQTKQLALLSRRVGTSLEAGIDIRTIWARESERGSLSHRRQIRKISDLVNQGQDVATAVRNADKYFPEIFCELLSVGEETGHLELAMFQLADFYDHRIVLRRTLLASIAWPMLQLVLAILIIGALILALGWVGQITGSTTDLLGFGLIGWSGFLIYILIVGLVSCFVVLFVWAGARGYFWIAPLQKILLRIPGLGNALKTLALSRMAWTLSLTTDTEMDVRRALDFAQRSTNNSHFTQHIPDIDATLMQGEQIHVALRRTQAYPAEFLDTIENGEESGRISESMKILADQFRARAQAAISLLTMFAGFAVFGLIAVTIAFIVIRLYLRIVIGPINDLLDTMP